MRTLVILVVGAFALGGSAFASDIALGATTSTCSVTGGTNNCSFSGFTGNLAVDGLTANPSLWVAPGGPTSSGGVANAYLLINLGSLHTNIANIQVQGLGNTGFFSAFDIFTSATAPTLANLSSLASATTWGGGSPVLNVANQVDSTSTLWTDTSGSLAGIGIQYIVYYAIPDTANAAAGCVATGTCPGTGTQEDAFANEIVANSTPEPATFGLFGFALAAIGVARRRFSK